MVAQAFTAISADAAGQARIDAHALADPERSRVDAGFDDDASDLVTQNHRMPNPYGPEPTLAVIVKVRSAYAPDLDFHTDVVGAERLVRHLLVAQVLGGVNDNSLHGSKPDALR